MTIIEAIFLGLVQGLTEFLPVSSSGHLLLAHHLMGIQEQALAFDVALHIGTLLALLTYFWRDLWTLWLGIIGKKPAYRRLAWLLASATLPAVISGVLLESAAESSFRSPQLVSINLIIVGFIMLAAENYAKRQKVRSSFLKIKASQALVMGMAQAAAVVPGVSRSGSTITAGLLAGLDRVAATRFSFLLGIPITAGAILKVLAGDSGRNLFAKDQGIVIIGIVTAALSGLVAIRFLMNYLSKHGLQIFAYYRIVLGLATIFLIRLL